jgi:formate-nitrite transporter family protein
MAAETSRLSAAEIFERVERGAEQELDRPVHNLLVSAVSAGLAMGISGLGVAVLLHVLGGDRVGESVAYLAYPLGFLIVIIGRQQLFTENTLFPVALVLEQRRHLARTARLWAVVLAGNVLGTLLFATLVTKTPALSPPVVSELATLGVEAGSRGFSTVFWTGVIGGWLIALVGWLVTASTDTVGQVLIIVLVTYVVGVGHFAHSVAGSGEVLAAVLTGALPLSSYGTWLAGAVLGNAVGGVVIVALFNYGQVHGAPPTS